MDRFTLLCNFEDFRNYVLSKFYTGWKKFKTHDALIKAQKDFNGKIFIQEPAQYPCIVEYWKEEDNGEHDTWDNLERFQYLYKNNLQVFKQLFEII